MWKTKEKPTRKEVESLFGKLNFIASVVHPGRIFISRILSFLKGLPSYGLHRIPQFPRKDIEWWENLLSRYNGIYMMAT